MSETRSGLDILRGNGPGSAGLARGTRVGIVCHPASVAADGRHLTEIWDSAALPPVKLFAPEHGVHGDAQDMEAVEAAREPQLDLPVVSLYGADAESLRPRAEDLAGLDAVVYDLQDVGSRYYTFVYTLSFMMEACAEAGIPIVVLDRPNPVGGLEIEGPPLDAERLASFVGRFALPVRHGMTTGELALAFREWVAPRVDLRVVWMEGWRRRMWFDQTGLPWVPPSPNMPTLATATVYPGGCLIEGTNLSEGRGTTTPFELCGAPWLDGFALARALRGEPGAAFRAATFRPMFQKHAGRSCHGLQVIVTDRERFRPFAAYLRLIAQARRQGGPFDWRREAYEFEHERLAIDLLLGVVGLREALEGDEPVAELERSWEDGLLDFNRRRDAWLHYAP